MKLWHVSSPGLWAAAVLWFGPVAAGAQVPPGPAYDGARHPNPVVTFVEIDDFRDATYAEARAESDLELLGLSAATGARQELHLAPGSQQRLRIGGRNTDVLFHPVVRQVFLLTGGEAFTLYSFRNPRPDLPAGMTAAILNQDAFRNVNDPEASRFGASAPPERLQVWGGDALLFDNPEGLTLFWQENGVSHVAVAAIDRGRLFEVIDDLL